MTDPDESEPSREVESVFDQIDKDADAITDAEVDERVRELLAGAPGAAVDDQRPCRDCGALGLDHADSCWTQWFRR